MTNTILKILLHVNLVLILILLVSLSMFVYNLNHYEAMNPVTIIGTAIVVFCLAYSAAFFIWNLSMYYMVYAKNIIKPNYFKNVIVTLIFAVILPYILITIDLLVY